MKDLIVLDTGILTDACSMAHGAPVFTLNRKHFARINGLRLHG